MADDDKAVAAVSARAVKLRRKFKAARLELKGTRGDAGGTLKWALDVQGAVAQVKPAPKADAKLQDVLAKSGRLQALAQLQQTLQRYASSRDDLAGQLSTAGQKRLMLGQLIKMAEVSVNQHTGGGNAPSGRRHSREVLAALMALKADQKGLQKSGKRVVPKPKVPFELGPDASVKELDQLIDALRVDDRQLKKAQAVFKKNTAATEDHVEALLAALSGGES